MRITKLVHSCLLVESDNQTAMIDPGAFSWQSGLVDWNKIARLDYLVVTHSHGDHLHQPFIEEIARRWPKVKLAANQEVTSQLETLGLEAADDGVNTQFTAPHEALPGGEQPPVNSGWHLFDRLTHPGDSLNFDETKEILALPYVAPWGSTTQAVELAKNLKPKAVVPIHDWHLSDTARDWYGGLLERALKPAGIKFVNLPNGQAVDI